MVEDDNEVSNEPAEDNDTDLANEPGHHVISDGEYLGTYDTEADAQSFIDQHLTPQDKNAEIVSVSDR